MNFCHKVEVFWTHSNSRRIHSGRHHTMKFIQINVYCYMSNSWHFNVLRVHERINPIVLWIVSSCEFLGICWSTYGVIKLRYCSFTFLNFCQDTILFSFYFIDNDYYNPFKIMHREQTVQKQNLRYIFFKVNQTIKSFSKLSDSWLQSGDMWPCWFLWVALVLHWWWARVQLKSQINACSEMSLRWNFSAMLRINV